MGKLSPREQRKTQQEAALLATLQHPNITHFIDSYLKCGARGSYLFIVMEYADGGTLYNMIQQRRPTYLPESAVLDALVQVCALDHLGCMLPG
jgi:NIMA (never in mitosis gene a)-related kinase